MASPLTREQSLQNHAFLAALERPAITPPLPALEQVTGWSRADAGKTPHHPERALFGGWRLGDLEE